MSSANQSQRYTYATCTMKNLLTISNDYLLRKILQPIHFLSVAAKAYSHFQVDGFVLNILMGMVQNHGRLVLATKISCPFPSTAGLGL
jgi:hypothetical protein